MRVCSARNKHTYPVALTVIHCRINLYLEVALSGKISGMIWTHNQSARSICVSNVYDRRRLYCVIITQLMHMHSVVVECKCPDWRKQLQVSSEYSRRRVQSPLVDPTARHKNICVGYRTAAPDSVDCHRRVTAGQFERRTIRAQLATYLFAGFTLRRTEQYCITHGEILHPRSRTRLRFQFATTPCCLLLQVDDWSAAQPRPWWRLSGMTSPPVTRSSAGSGSARGRHVRPLSVGLDSSVVSIVYFLPGSNRVLKQ